MCKSFIIFSFLFHFLATKHVRSLLVCLITLHNVHPQKIYPILNWKVATHWILEANGIRQQIGLNDIPLLSNVPSHHLGYLWYCSCSKQIMHFCYFWRHCVANAEFSNIFHWQYQNGKNDLYLLCLQH